MPTAVVLPGRHYGHDQPGLFLVEVALERAGLTVVRAHWPEAGMPQEAGEAAAAVAAVAVPLLEEHTPAYVVAKSLGTLAAPLAAERGTAAIWLTPLLDEPRCLDGVLANPAPQLLVGGEADFAWDPAGADAAARAGATPVVLPGADHGFLVPKDAAATAHTLVLLVRAVTDFLDAAPDANR